MRDILGYYQNIPLHIDPIAFTIGSFSVGWYSLMYLAALGIIYFLLSFRLEKDILEEGWADFYDPSLAGKKISKADLKNKLVDLLLFAFMGALIGGRLGYVIFYNPLYYFHSPISIISPYDFSIGRFIGIYGMSYHGGLIGAMAASFIFAKKSRLNFWKLADFAVPAVPAGYFFGRIGNFLNLELYGRVTNSWIGMYFPISTGAGRFLRFPSQIIEACLEGLVLFVILWSMRNRKMPEGSFIPVYLVGYGTARFLGEFFREPDEQIGFFLSAVTLGQIFSLLMILGGIGLYYFQKRRKIV
jgi:phosphatidylglycerol---prolipoprotein diacylglyceryl transferase